MIKKIKLFLYLIILLIGIQIIINYTYVFYNNKHNINLSLENFNESSININDKTLTFYIGKIINNENFNYENLIVLHDLFKSSLNSLSTIDLMNLNSNESNYNIILVDLPFHGKSFKEKNLDHSYRNIAYYLNSFIEKLNIENPKLVCDNLSSNIGINMVCMNDTLISKLILINPNFKYNKSFVNITNKLTNKLNTLKYFLGVTLLKKQEYINMYKNFYINDKLSSSNHVTKILKESNPIKINEVPKNIKTDVLINKYNNLNSMYTKDLFSDFNTIIFSPKLKK